MNKLILATLLVGLVALGVAAIGVLQLAGGVQLVADKLSNLESSVLQVNGKLTPKRLGGVTNYDSLELAETLYVVGSTTLKGEVSMGSTTRGSIEIDLAAGDEQECWQNSTGANIRVQYAEIGYLSGAASSSFDMFLFATTSTSVPAGHAYVALAPIATSSIIGSTLFATSTVASTTNNLVYALGRNGEGLLNTVAPNMNVCLYLQQGDLVASCTAGTEAGQCESATSTARGFNPFASFDYRRL